MAAKYCRGRDNPATETVSVPISPDAYVISEEEPYKSCTPRPVELNVD